MKTQLIQLGRKKHWGRQRGASFVSWMILAAAAVFVLVTIAKVVPIYMEFATVKSMVDEIASDESLAKQKNSRQLRAQLNKYMNVNGLYTVQPEYFSLVNLPEQKNARALQVEYEVRKHWLANIDLTMNFHHAAVLKRQN